MPPWSEVQEVLLKVALAGGGAASLVALLVRLFGARLAPLAAALGVVAGFAVANSHRDATAYLPEAGPFHVVEKQQAAVGRAGGHRRVSSTRGGRARTGDRRYSSR